MIKQSIRSISSKRSFSFTISKFAKGDESTIDSFRLPSQTSINEWEFKYDFIPKTSQPKIPPISKEAVKQDIANEKAKFVERELFTKESNSSVKVEANSAQVLHGGETIGEEPEYIEDKQQSKPIDVSNPNSPISKKSSNHDKYVQSSINPNINQSNVHNLSEGEVDHKIETINKQSPIIEDIEHDNLTNQSTTTENSNSSKNNNSSNKTGLSILGLLGVGGIGYYYYNSSSKKTTK